MVTAVAMAMVAPSSVAITCTEAGVQLSMKPARPTVRLSTSAASERFGDLISLFGGKRGDEADRQDARHDPLVRRGVQVREGRELRRQERVARIEGGLPP